MNERSSAETLAKADYRLTFSQWSASIQCRHIGTSSAKPDGIVSSLVRMVQDSNNTAMRVASIRPAIRYLITLKDAVVIWKRFNGY
jgi:hypothetical protein